MADFTYTARSANGQIQKGTVAAANKAAATSSLKSRALQPLIIKPKGRSGGLNINMTLPGSSGVKSKDLVVFTRQFATMINAGVPMLKSLNTMKEQTESPILKNVVTEVASDVEGGAPLSDALAKHPKIFSSIYVNMVAAGETGGILDEVLNRLATQQEKDSALKAKIRSAMIYPSVIGVVTILAFFILMTFIVPKIGHIITTLGSGKLPIYTRGLLAVSNIMKKPEFILTVVIGVPLLIIVFRRWKKTPKGRYQWHSFLLKLPVIKVIITKVAIARFARIFASLMAAGVSIVDTINTTAGAMGNAVIEKELLDSNKAIKEGGQLSTELAKSPHFPKMVTQMLAIGEETGQTDTIIIKVAEFYEQEVDSVVASISSIIEPVMIIVLGGIVGLIAISVFGPITQISSGAGSK